MNEGGKGSSKKSAIPLFSRFCVLRRTDMTKILGLGEVGAIIKMAKNSYADDKFGKIACARGRGFVDLRECFVGGALFWGFCFDATRTAGDTRMRVFRVGCVI
jgi:hypothetical protein